MVRSTGVVGLVTFVVLFAAIIAMSPGEPPFTASPEEARAFYLNSTAGWVQAAMAVAGLAAIGWIWFVVGLCLLLGRAEGSPPWRSAVALVSGVRSQKLRFFLCGFFLAVVFLDGSWRRWPFAPAIDDHDLPLM
jgi:hypothetical protein